MAQSLREKRRRELERQRRQRRLLVGVAVVVVVLVAGFFIYRATQQQISGLQTFDGLSRDHAVNVSIPETGLPPAGGTHNPRWLNCGVYEQPVETMQAVHSLEHGAVWLTYHPDLSQDAIATVEAYAEGDSFVLVSPYPGLESDVVATAWGAQLQIDELPDERIEQFIARFRGQGPEPGAQCSGGVGAPRGS
ncbi:MAG: DUF3105 domain-containing protein [Candidatus Promineifilaceae bacterium]|nr:DUF3105 domain-containing protein [Candidatus Promineifilaceae bacterium]